MLNFRILTIFPELFKSFLETSLIGKAIEKEIINISIINIRDYTSDKHKMVDDTPYGGGAGMVMKVEPIVNAIRGNSDENTHKIYLTPKGKLLNQELIKNLSKRKDILLLCGRYEDIDKRAIDLEIDELISIGDYVLNGGEIPSMVLIEGISRLLPNFIGKEDSFIYDSFYNKNNLDYDHYTRPREFENLKVPEVLLSGNHKEIEKFRLENSLKNKILYRPDLLRENLTKSESDLLNKLKVEND